MDSNYRMNMEITDWNEIYIPQISRKNTEYERDMLIQERKNVLAQKRKKQIMMKRKRRKRKIRRLVKMVIRFFTLFVIMIILFTILTFIIKLFGRLAGTDTQALEPNYHKVKEISVDEVRETDIYQYVSEHPDLYPEDMTKRLEKNPELLEFVSHYLEYEPVSRGGINEDEQKEKCPLFMQWDERWGYVSYGDDNIGFSGCGPTCISMVIYSLTRDESVTPDEIGRYAMEQGYYVYGTGTSWDLMTAAAGAYGINVSTMSMDEGMLKDSLDAGQLFIASMGPGDFTSTGHFIVIYGYNEEGFFVNDPNSKKRSNKVWSFDSLSGQVRNLWVYYK